MFFDISLKTHTVIAGKIVVGVGKLELYTNPH